MKCWAGKSQSHVQIREVPRAKIDDGWRAPMLMSQSHRTDQGSSKSSPRTECLSGLRVAIPPYRSGKFQVGTEFHVSCLKATLSHPTVQIREVPRFAVFVLLSAHPAASQS